LKHGADVALATTDAADGFAAGSTALSVARHMGRDAIVELLIRRCRRLRRQGGKSGLSAR